MFAPIGAAVEPPVQAELLAASRARPGISQPSQKALNVEEILRQHDHLVILGDPGSGKTTLAKYLVVALVDSLPELAALSAVRAIPVRVPLQKYAEYRHRYGDVGISILDFLRDFAKTELQIDSLGEDFFQYYLERKKGLLIFDGLDEIFNSHLREQVRNDVVTFTQMSYPGNKVVISSRKWGYEEAGFPQPEFFHYEIRPFDDRQVSEYVEKWYRLEEADRSKRKDEIAQFEQARRNLPEELTSNPLLLSLIVILFRSGCTLPESKLEIYRSCVETLTEKWDATGKRLEVPPEYTGVRDKKSAFARLAYLLDAKGTERRPEGTRAVEVSGDSR